MATSFAQIITALSADMVADAADVTPQLVASWKHRDSIPPKHWRKICTAAQAEGHEWVTLEVFAKAAEGPAERRYATVEGEGEAVAA